MAKIKTTFFCKNCGSQSSKWLGRCPTCQEWDTFVEEVVEKQGATAIDWRDSSILKKIEKAQKINEIENASERRYITKDGELNRVLGGGLIEGSLILIGGEPGIGKSTLMLQMALQMSDLTVLYVSGEESATQIKMRAERLSAKNDNCYILTETVTQHIFKQIVETNPDVVIIDSIQTLSSVAIESSVGSIGQIKECTAELMKFAKETGTPVFLIGHITKDGAIAGPKMLEHMVDTVLTFEGDRHMNFRILRTSKNRFGSTAELGIYEMKGDGLREVSNPSELLISQRNEDTAGVAIAAMQEGNRPLLIEIQALVSTATYGTPQRSSTGFDAKRLNMLLAVLEKRGGFRLGNQDVFLNVAGGLKVEDPAVDLAVVLAVVSSLEEKPISSQIAFAAEIGLGGEVRAVSKIEQRIAEATKLGYKQIYVSKFNFKTTTEFQKFNIKVIPVATLDDIFLQLFT